MDQEDRTSLIREYFRALDEAEYERLSTVFTSDVRYSYPGAEDRRTLDETLSFLEHEKRTTNTDHEIERLAHTEGATFCEGTVTADHPDEGRIETEFVDVFEFDADTDRITSVDVYTR